MNTNTFARKKQTIFNKENIYDSPLQPIIDIIYTPIHKLFFLTHK